MPRSSRQRQILQAMNIDLWLPREQIVKTESSIELESSEQVSSAAPEEQSQQSTTPTRSPSPVGKEVISAVQKTANKKASDTVEEIKVVAPDAQKISMAEWSELKSLVSDCTGCALHQGRTQTVFGVGAQQADWLVSLSLTGMTLF